LPAATTLSHEMLNARSLPGALLLVAAVSACGGRSMTAPPPPGDSATIALQLVASGLSSPTWLTSPPNDARLFILEQPGRIRIVRDGQLLATPFLDLTAKASSGAERGLLGLAFHPDYAQNGYFYVDYTDLSGNTRVERYHADPSADVADPASAQLILGVQQPYANHNGGDVVFGPDGMLYVGLGDGGSGGDPQGNGQNRDVLLGKILRLDVDHGDPYVIPADNPFVGQAGARGEIWAYGLRNPWRFAFDPTTGLLYIADVGQDLWEEVDVEPATTAGLDYGWNIMEATHCYNASSCNESGLTLPVLEYGHDQGCSIIGGFVYRGAAIPALHGVYFYADYCSGWIRSFRYQDGQVTDQRTWDSGDVGEIHSFGQDAAGELYVVVQDGRVYRITTLSRD
jgi:glucose/arabinose dehydrogenase